MWDEEKVLAGNKGCSELFRHKQEVLKRGGEVCAGQPSALSPPDSRFLYLQLGMVFGCLRDKAIVLHEVSWFGE